MKDKERKQNPEHKETKASKFLMNFSSDYNDVRAFEVFKQTAG